MDQIDVIVWLKSTIGSIISSIIATFMKNRVSCMDFVMLVDAILHMIPKESKWFFFKSSKPWAKQMIYALKFVKLFHRIFSIIWILIYSSINGFQNARE